MKYSEWLNEWMETCVKPFKKQRTIEKYERNLTKNIKPMLGDYELNALNPSILQKFTASMVSSFAPSTVGCILAIVNGSLKQAVTMGLMEQHFMGCVLRPKIEEHPIQCFSMEEQKRIEKYVIESSKTKYIGILICLYTGIRIGELLALKWADIDFQKEVLSVVRSCHDGWCEEGYIKIIDTPKTKSSMRTIPIPKQLLPYIKKAKKSSTSEYVIYGKDKPISVRSYQRSFELVLERLHIPHRGFHALRHTFATRAIECGMDIKTLSELLGHKNAAVTLNRYAHSLMEHKSAMMNKLGKLLQ